MATAREDTVVLDEIMVVDETLAEMDIIIIAMASGAMMVMMPTVRACTVVHRLAVAEVLDGIMATDQGVDSKDRRETLLKE